MGRHFTQIWSLDRYVLITDQFSYALAKQTNKQKNASHDVGWNFIHCKRANFVNSVKVPSADHLPQKGYSNVYWQKKARNWIINQILAEPGNHSDGSLTLTWHNSHSASLLLNPTDRSPPLTFLLFVCLAFLHHIDNKWNNTSLLCLIHYLRNAERRRDAQPPSQLSLTCLIEPQGKKKKKVGTDCSSKLRLFSSAAVVFCLRKCLGSYIPPSTSVEDGTEKIASICIGCSLYVKATEPVLF